MNMILFGNKIFIEEIKLRGDHNGLECTLNLTSGFLIRERRRHEEEGHMTMEAQIGMIQPSQGMSRIASQQELERGKGFFPSLWREHSFEKSLISDL